MLRFTHVSTARAFCQAVAVAGRCAAACRACRFTASLSQSMKKLLPRNSSPAAGRLGRRHRPADRRHVQLERLRRPRPRSSTVCRASCGNALLGGRSPVSFTRYVTPAWSWTFGDLPVEPDRLHVEQVRHLARPAARATSFVVRSTISLPPSVGISDSIFSGSNVRRRHHRVEGGSLNVADRLHRRSTRSSFRGFSSWMIATVLGRLGRRGDLHHPVQPALVVEVVERLARPSASVPESVASRAMPITPSGHGTSWVPPAGPSIFTASVLAGPCRQRELLVLADALPHAGGQHLARRASPWWSPRAHCSTTWPNRATVIFCSLVA